MADDELDRTERRVGTATLLTKIEALHEDIHDIKDRVAVIERVAFVGNGQPSHGQRITAIEAGQGRVSIAVLISVLTAAGSFLKDFWLPHAK